MNELIEIFNKLGINYKIIEAKGSISSALTSNLSEIIEYDTTIILENGIGYGGFFCEFYFKDGKFLNYGVWE